MGALDSITGAIAQADILGIFGREQLDYGTVWGSLNPSPANPGVFAFKIFLNYDGNGDQFGGTSVSATSDNPDALSIFAAQRYDSALTVLVLNKTASAIADSPSAYPTSRPLEPRRCGSTAARTSPPSCASRPT